MSPIRESGNTPAFDIAPSREVSSLDKGIRARKGRSNGVFDMLFPNCLCLGE